MTPLLQPFLVNDAFGDPALYVDFRFERRGLLLDLGDIAALDARRILRLSDVFVSHAHVDHFIGFDQLLRVCFGRDKLLRLYGPEGFIERVAHRLAGYAWNLAERYRSELRLEVTEIVSTTRTRVALFRAGERFRPGPATERGIADGVILADDLLLVRAAVLDHRIPCLAFAIEERAHVNIWKNRLEARGLAVGPWLRELKRAVLLDAAADTPIPVAWRPGHAGGPAALPLGELARSVAQVTAGQKIVYVVDVLYSASNIESIVGLARDADLLFIEAAFADADSERAAERHHLTTVQAGWLGRQAGVRRLEPFHFSPRHAGEEGRLRREVAAAFAGEIPQPRPTESPRQGTIRSG